MSLVSFHFSVTCLFRLVCACVCACVRVSFEEFLVHLGLKAHAVVDASSEGRREGEVALRPRTQKLVGGLGLSAPSFPIVAKREEAKNNCTESNNCRTFNDASTMQTILHEIQKATKRE